MKDGLARLPDYRGLPGSLPGPPSEPVRPARWRSVDALFALVALAALLFAGICYFISRLLDALDFPGGP